MPSSRTLQSFLEQLNENKLNVLISFDGLINDLETAELDDIHETSIKRNKVT